MRANRAARKVFRVVRKGHWLLWGNILFMTASVLWLASPLVAWGASSYDETGSMAGIIGTTATSLYLVDAIVYFVDWWVKKMADEESVYGQKELAHTSLLQRFDFYFVGNCFFLLGVVGDYVTAHYGEVDEFWAYVWYAGSMVFWAVYAILEMIRCTVDRVNRDRLEASARFYFCPFEMCNRGIDRSCAVHVNFAWDMMGAIFFFLGSIIYLLSALIWYNALLEEPHSLGYTWMEVAAALMFILNSACLFVNHGVMRWLKKVRFSLLVSSFLLSVTQGMIFYRDTDLETTKDMERTRDREAITRDAEYSHDFEPAPSTAGPVSYQAVEA